MNILILHRSKFNPQLYSNLTKLGHQLFILKKKENKFSDDFKYSYLEEFENFDSQLVELSVHLLQKTIQFDRIIAPHEYDILRAGKLRSLYNIYGQDEKSALHFRDKYVMKNKLREQGINLMPFSKIESLSCIINFIEEYGYPVVIKPRLGASAINVEVINSQDQLQIWLEKDYYLTPGGKYSNNLQFIIEKFVDGTMYHVDGLIIENSIKFIKPFRYLTTCLAYKDGKPNGSTQLDDDNPLLNRLITYAQQILRVLPTPSNLAFHGEYFHTKDDKIFLCEIASRVGGGQINKCLEISNNVNLIELSILAEVSNINQNEFLEVIASDCIERTGFLTIESKPGILKKYEKESPFTWVKLYVVHAEIGTKLNIPNSVSDYICSVIVVGKNEKEISKRLWQFYEWFWQVTEIS